MVSMKECTHIDGICSSKYKTDEKSPEQWPRTNNPSKWKTLSNRRENLCKSSDNREWAFT